VSGGRSPAASYVLVHVVASESLAELIGPQVIDPLRTQASINGDRRPANVIALFLEPARVALSSRMRRRIAAFRERAPEIDVMLHPFVSRLGIERNARIAAVRLRRRAKRRRIVFHCRGEQGSEWASAMQAHLPDSVIVADIRGAWPEEFLFLRGYNGPEGADPDSLRGYEHHLGRLRTTLAHASGVLSVSPGMLQWLESQGAHREQLTYVPCCVRALTFERGVREAMRAQLSLSHRVVLAYAGTLGRYQHIEDGLIPFFRAMAEGHSDVHLLAIVPDPETLRRMLHAQGVPSDRATVVAVAQHEVARYLSAADAGLLLRAPSRMNRFSQPTKLGEYLAAGLPVIVSRGTGQVDELVTANDAGFAVDAFDVSWPELVAEANRVWQALRSRGEILRENALRLCEREFLWTSYTERVRDVYTRALATPT
jgi:glycosyltransferase involved in cell wall biosynthesis